MFSFAFQPIVDIQQRNLFAYEALVRGPAGEPAPTVLNAFSADELLPFDRDARVQAIRLAASLNLNTALSLNFLPASLDALPDAISSTLDAATECAIPASRLILEITEGQVIHDPQRFAERINAWRSRGLRLAIDDFGAGYSGLNLLAEFQPDIVKIDMSLVRDIASKGPRQAIARATLQACRELGIEVVAEGVETEAEFRWFRRHGVVLFQGYYFGRPEFQTLPASAFLSTSQPQSA